MQRWKEQLLRWWIGANRAALQGGALGVKAFLGTAGASEVAHQVGWNFSALTLQQLGVVFATAFIYDFVGYLGEHPLPEIPNGTDVTKA